MSEGGEKIPLDEARKLIDKYLGILKAYTDRAEAAGSVRRERPQVGDLEIVCRPATNSLVDLWGNITDSEYATESPQLLKQLGKPIKGGEKYKRFQTAEGVFLDLFIVTPPAEWGVILLMRTGSRDFNKRLFRKKQFGGWMPSDIEVHDGALWRGLEKIQTPEEADVFRAIGREYIPPQERSL